jgi:hypothetical protein
MKSFILSFAIALVLQVILILATLIIGHGDYPLYPYWLPYAFLPLFTSSTEQVGQGLLVLVFLFSLPAIFYSLIFAVIVLGVRELFHRPRRKIRRTI